MLPVYTYEGYGDPVGIYHTKKEAKKAAKTLVDGADRMDFLEVPFFEQEMVDSKIKDELVLP